MAGFFLMLGEAQGEVKPLDRAKHPPSSAAEKTIHARLSCVRGQSPRFAPHANQGIR
jgi:hypothetical protein